MMENKKTLKVNAAICDVRKITEDILSIYDSVEINAATIISNQAAQILLGKYHAQLNGANVQILPDDTRFATFNGKVVISPSAAIPDEKIFQIINGFLDIEPGSENALKGYTKIVVNGFVTCPKSLADMAGGLLTVNGRFDTYPDGCIRLKNTAILDRFFHLRAKQGGVYYASKRIVALSPEINFEKLAEKNVQFITKKLLVSESLAEAAVPFFDEKVNISVFPDGCAYVGDDAVLDDALVKRYGTSLYIDGDLTIPAGAAGLLDQIKFLKVDGSLLVSRSLKERVLSMDIEYDGFDVVGGTLIADASSHTITAYMLEHAEDGLSAIHCSHVSIDASVTPELLREKLVSIIGCASVSCATDDQVSALALAGILKDVASVSLEGCDGDKDGDEDENAVVINAAFYEF